MIQRILTKHIFLFSLIWAMNGGLQAAEGSYTNYIPLYGDFAVAVPPEPGWLVRNDFYYYNADTEKDLTLAPGLVRDDLEITLAVNLFSVFKVLEKRIFGARYFFGLTFTTVYADAFANLNAGPERLVIDVDRTAISDMTITPWSFYWTIGKVHLGFLEYVVVPNGSYDPTRAVNAGLNYYSFDTNFAFTYLNDQTGREVSFNFGHIYNTENTETKYQTGQEIHLDYMFNQFLSETFAVGIHGFHHDQIERDSGEGATLGAFKVEDSGIGPALFWMPKIAGKDVVFITKWLMEYHTENRAEGDYVFFSFGLQL